MHQQNVFKATSDTPATRVSSARHRVTTTSGSAGAEELATTALAASAASFSLHRAPPSRWQRSSARHFLWFSVQPALSSAGIIASPEPSQRPSGPVEGGGGAQRINPPAAAPLAPTPPPTPEPAASAEAATKPLSAISRVELTIDSLRTYDLVRPIPVVVESLGERNFVAEMPDLNISTTASNPSEIIITLKDRIAQVYDSLRILKHLDAEQSRQLRVLESYIAKSRRGWLDRR